MKKLAIVLLSLVAATAEAQSMAPQHVMVPGVIVDGSAHPEQIPDLVAYRLFFVSASVPSNATSAQKLQQAGRVARVRLNAADSQTFVNALAAFKAQYSDLISNYNDSVQTALASHGEPDPSSFLRLRDGLVQSTVAQLKASLSGDGFSKLAAFIQGEKAHMKLARPAPKQQ